VAHRHLILAGLVLVGLVACGGSRAVSAPAASGSEGAPNRSAPSYTGDNAAWGKFHSKRFQVTIPLPDGRVWKIDDHRGPDLLAMHEPTSSKLMLVATQEEELMNRQRCEERARSRGWLEQKNLTTVEDEVHVGPDAYDSRVWVALEAGRPGGGLEGHVFLFGAFLRRCLLVHLSTAVPSPKDEEVLASRLAVGSARIVKAITLDPLRTTDDANVPRDKPDIRR
jgi:hypothetical protein